MLTELEEWRLLIETLDLTPVDHVDHLGKVYLARVDLVQESNTAYPTQFFVYVNPDEPMWSLLIKYPKTWDKIESVCPFVTKYKILYT